MTIEQQRQHGTAGCFRLVDGSFRYSPDKRTIIGLSYIQIVSLWAVHL